MAIDITKVIPPSPQRDNEGVRVMRHYFKLFCQEENIPEGQALQVVPEYLFNWLRQRWGGILDEVEGYALAAYEQERDEVCDKLKVHPDHFLFVTKLAYSYAGPSQVTPIWPSVVLVDRPPPKVPLRSLHACFLLEWEDGSFMPYSCFVPAELASTAGVPAENGLTDAVVANQLWAFVRSWVADIVTQGIDVLRDTKSSRYGGEYPFNVLMGLMRYIVEANKAIRDGTTVNIAKFAEEHGLTAETMKRLGGTVPQLDPKILDYMDGYLRLCQAMIRPPMPKEYRDEIARRRAARAIKPKTISGGWDG